MILARQSMCLKVEEEEDQSNRYSCCSLERHSQQESHARTNRKYSIRQKKEKIFACNRIKLSLIRLECTCMALIYDEKILSI